MGLWEDFLEKPSPRHNKQSTNQQASILVGKAYISQKNGQKCIFWGINGRFGAKHPILLERAKLLVLSHQKIYPGTSSHCFLVGCGTKWAKKANIWLNMTKNVNFGPNLGQKNQHFGEGVKLLVPTYQKTTQASYLFASYSW